MRLPMFAVMSMLAFHVGSQAASRCGTSINTDDAGRISDPSVVAIASDAEKRRKLLACDANGLNVVAKKGFSLSEAAVSNAFDKAMFDAVRTGRTRDVAQAIHANVLANETGANVETRFKARWQADWCARHAGSSITTLEPPDAPDYRMHIKALNKKTIEMVRHIATAPLRNGLPTCNASVKKWIERVRHTARP